MTGPADDPEVPPRLAVLAAGDTVYVFADRGLAAGQAVMLIGANLDVDWFFLTAAAWETARTALPSHVRVVDVRHLGSPTSGVLTPVTVWVCTDCAQIQANGELGDDRTPDAEPLWLLSGMTVVAGMHPRDHDARCPRRIAGGQVEECDCETVPYSTTQCAGCGSSLAGDRHALTVFRR